MATFCHNARKVLSLGGKECLPIANSRSQLSSLFNDCYVACAGECASRCALIIDCGREARVLSFKGIVMSKVTAQTSQ